jgi:transcriptional regulator with XRE-family HTH domain
MRRPKSTNAATAGRREAAAIAATLGGDAKRARAARRATQAQVASRIGVSRSRYADLERGEGAAAPLELWVQVGIALGRPLAVAFSRDLESPSSGPLDAGHLAGQELVLRLARQHGRHPDVELTLGSGRQPHTADVVLRDQRQRTLMLLEILNRITDLGGSARSTERKARELEGLAILAGGDRSPYRVAVGWLLTDTAANRRIAATYPEFFRSRFGGSSVALARALVDGTDPPARPAVVWIDPARGRIHALRLPGSSPARSRATLPP